MKQCILSVLLALALVTAPVPSARAAEPAAELDICSGSITITATGYTQGDAAEETPHTGGYRISQSDLAPTANTIRITGGAHTIALTGTQLNLDTDGHGAAAVSLTGSADVSLVLEAPVTLRSAASFAGLQVEEHASLTVSAADRSGMLSVTGGSEAAAIGSANQAACGSITIESGKISAVGGNYAAGIGSGSHGRFAVGSQIHITGTADVTASANDGAAIGGGSQCIGTGSDGQILIDGSARVKAIGADGGAGIGGGYTCAGTGAGGAIRIGGSAVVTASADSGCAIGGGKMGNGTGERGAIAITDQAQVTAVSKYNTAIGGDSNYEQYQTTGDGTGRHGSITIDGQARVTATGDRRGIGGYYATGAYGTITIGGQAVVTATTTSRTSGSGYYNAYGIGGDNDTEGGSTISITGGHVTATGYHSGLLGGKISLIDGTLVAGRTYAGSSYSGMSANVQAPLGSTIWASVSTTGSTYDRFLSGVLFQGDEGVIRGDFYQLTADQEIPEGATLTVAADQELVIPAGRTLTVKGTLVSSGSLVIDGTLAFADGGSAVYARVPTGSGSISDPARAFPVAISGSDAATDALTYDLSTLFTIPEGTGAATYTAVSENGGEGTVEGSTLSILRAGAFTVTVRTAPGGFYAPGQATAVLTAANGSIPHSHSLQELAEAAPSCEEPGHIHCWYCSGCGRYFADAQAVRELSRGEALIPPAGHKYVSGVCTVCGKTDPALGENPPTVRVGSVTGYVGDQITVPVTIANNPGIASMMVEIRFDPAVLKLVAAEIRPEYAEQPEAQSATNPGTDSVVLNWLRDPGSSSVCGTFANLTFEVIGSADTVTPLEIRYDPENIFDENQTNVTFAAGNGAVTVRKFRPGDLNGDSTVDIRDAQLLLKHVTGLDTPELVGQPDVTGDGKVNNKDVITLLRSLVGYAVTLH